MDFEELERERDRLWRLLWLCIRLGDRIGAHGIGRRLAHLYPEG